MTKLTEKEREGFEEILKKDLNAINRKFIDQIKDFWNIARQNILKEKGWDKLIAEKESLELQQRAIKERINEIEHIFKTEPLRVEQCVALGGKVDDHGHVKGAHFYGIPVTSQFEYEIVEYIRRYIDLEIPAKMLRDVCEASIRALAMSGTFEEARSAYEKFYSMDFRKYGVDIPPRLEEICSDKKLMAYQESLQQIEGIKPLERKSLPLIDNETGSDEVTQDRMYS